MKPYRLTAGAEDHLAEIFEWTARQFGRRPADTYLGAIVERCSMLAAGVLPTLSCHAICGDLVPDHLRMVRAGSHYIVFTETGAEFVIVDILHQSADLLPKLASLSPPDEA